MKNKLIQELNKKYINDRSSYLVPKQQLQQNLLFLLENKSIVKEEFSLEKIDFIWSLLSKQHKIKLYSKGKPSSKELTKKEKIFWKSNNRGKLVLKFILEHNFKDFSGFPTDLNLLQLDHRIPLRFGGLDLPENWRLLHKGVNSIFGNISTNSKNIVKEEIKFLKREISNFSNKKSKSLKKDSLKTLSEKKYKNILTWDRKRVIKEIEENLNNNTNLYSIYKYSRNIGKINPITGRKCGYYYIGIRDKNGHARKIKSNKSQQISILKLKWSIPLEKEDFNILHDLLKSMDLNKSMEIKLEKILYDYTPILPIPASVKNKILKKETLEIVRIIKNV